MANIVAGTPAKKLEKIEQGIAIVANGNTHTAITTGQYVYVKGHSTLAEGMYTATAAIAENAALSTSNLTAKDRGGLNSLKAGLDTLDSKFTSFIGNDTTSDCNSETATGFKKAINSTANTPYAGHFVVFTFNYNQNEMIQLAMSTSANAIYFRYYNGSWGSWKMLGWNS